MKSDLSILLVAFLISSSLLYETSAAERPRTSMFMRQLGMGKRMLPTQKEMGWPRLLPVYEAGKTITMKKALDSPPSGYHFDRDADDFQKTLRNYQVLNRYNSIKQLMFGR